MTEPQKPATTDVTPKPKQPQPATNPNPAGKETGWHTGPTTGKPSGTGEGDRLENEK